MNKRTEKIPSDKVCVQKRNVILVDMNPSKNWDFLIALQQETGEKWTIEKLVCNKDHGSALRNIIRYAKYFFFSFKIFIHRDRYARIIAWQQFFGLIFAFYSRIFRVKKSCQLIVMTFIYKPKNRSFIGKIYDRFVRFCVTSDYIDHIVVYSSYERKHYSTLFTVPEGKFFVTRLGIADVSENYKHSSIDKYYVAAGRSNRDYNFLSSCWKEAGGGVLLKVICDSLNCTGTDAITFLNNCHGDDYLNELSACYGVVIPLEDEVVSSGQLVILQAMMFSKPIIVTHNRSVFDYIKDGKEGYIINKDCEALTDAVHKLEDCETYRRISSNSRNTFETTCSVSNLGRNIAALVRACDRKGIGK